MEDAGGEPQVDAQIGSLTQEVLTDEEGDFALPFRWPPQSTATTEVVEAGDQWVPVGRLRGLLQAEVIIANETFRVVEVDAGNPHPDRSDGTVPLGDRDRRAAFADRARSRPRELTVPWILIR